MYLHYTSLPTRVVSDGFWGTKCWGLFSFVFVFWVFFFFGGGGVGGVRVVIVHISCVGSE